MRRIKKCRFFSGGMLKYKGGYQCKVIKGMRVPLVCLAFLLRYGVKNVSKLKNERKTVKSRKKKCNLQ